MESIENLEKALDAILKVDKAQRKASAGLGSIPAQYLKPGAQERMQALMEAQKKAITQKNISVLSGPLFELAKYDTDEAVKAVQRLFSSKIVEYRLLALKVLSKMSSPSSGKVIAKRASFWSGASKEEKKLAKSLLGSGPLVLCAHCLKTIRGFPVPPGQWAGTLAELTSLKIEPDHGFKCESCGQVICPVCSGAKASDLGVQEFVCTECGYKPLKTIFRG